MKRESIFGENMSVYIEDPKESIYKLVISKIVVHKIDM